MDKETAELLGLPYEEEEDSSLIDKETSALLGLPYEEETAQPPLSGLSARDRLRQRLEKDIEESEATETQSFQTVLQDIEAAKQRLLAQPSRRETLQQIATKLTQPRERTDPRFYERQNLYTFLRDIGEVGAEQTAARKTAEQEAAKLDQLANKYRLERTQDRGSKARQLLAQYLSKEPETQTGRGLTSEFERLIADLPAEEQAAMRRQRATMLSTRAPSAERAPAQEGPGGEAAQFIWARKTLADPNASESDKQAAKDFLERKTPNILLRERIGQDKQAQSILADLRQKTRFAIPDINFAIEQVDKGGRQAAGLIANMIKGIPIIGQPATDLEKTLISLQATLGFDKLKEFKEMSPTGASGLGAVSNAENRLLQAVQGSLEIDQSPANLKRNLNRIKEFYEKDVNERMSSLGISFEDFEAMPQKQSGGKSPAELAADELKRRREGKGGG